MSRAPKWFHTINGILRSAIMGVSCTLIVLMVIFTIYTVVMRYVFRDPPYWGDTVSMFCNIWLVLIAYGLAVRDRQDIATEGIYAYLSPRAVRALRYVWQTLALMFGVFLIWFGFDAALNVPGQFLELGRLPKKVPMMVLPLSGLLVTLASAAVIAEDAFRWREPENSAPGTTVI